MSTPELPADPRDWPTDPFALLGVERGAAETDVKRAYTRLIRRFKPEHAPEQFRRIREAYEACLDRLRWFASPPPDFFAVRVPPATDGPAGATPPDDARPVDPASPPPELPRPAPVVDEADRLWAAAVEGRDEEAYRGLADLATARPDRADVPLRLYWLLGVNPALDHTRTRHDWLADALARSRLTGPAAELYRRELEASAGVGLSGPYWDLMTVPAHPRDALAVARWRLAAAGRTQSWHPADADLQGLAKRLPFEDESGWLGHLVAALDWAAWERPPPFYYRYREELDRLRHLELSHAHAFDRVEETEHVAAAWREVVGQLGVPGILELLPHAWAGHGEVAPAVLGPAVAAMAADPEASLAWTDRIVRRGGGDLLVLVARALETHRRGYGPADEPEFPPELVRGLVQGLRGGLRWGYDTLRPDLLDLLVAEAIHPVELADACADHPEARARQLADSVRRDIGLRLVWLAVRLYRG